MLTVDCDFCLLSDFRNFSFSNFKFHASYISHVHTGCYSIDFGEKKRSRSQYHLNAIMVEFINKWILTVCTSENEKLQLILSHPHKCMCKFLSFIFRYWKCVRKERFTCRTGRIEAPPWTPERDWSVRMLYAQRTFNDYSRVLRTWWSSGIFTKQSGHIRIILQSNVSSKWSEDDVKYVADICCANCHRNEPFIRIQGLFTFH